jgi:uncharacterized GH25 family protein
MKKSLLLIVGALIASPAAAHMVWLERTSPDTVHAHFGELGHREKTGALLDKVVPTIFTEQTQPLPITRGEDYIEAKATGDVRLADERYAPFSEGKKGIMRPVMYARAGRIETVAKMPYEFVPLAADGDTFTLLLNGTPQVGKTVKLIDPDGLDEPLVTDERGQFTIKPTDKGQYILRASTIEPGAGTLAGAPYDFTARVTTLSFTRD